VFSRGYAILPDQPPTLLQAYLDNRPGLTRLLRARLGSDEEAEDVLQELYLHLRRPIDAQRIDNFAAYLYRMALNLARDHRRGRDRARRRDADWADASQTTLGPDAIVDLPDAEAVYGARQRLARLAAAIAALPPQCRRVFTLHKLQGLSHAEIATKLHISRSAVEKHMGVALKHLARQEAADRMSAPDP
jgi:RNA polymerase sigma-70 factor (ECF subfamily)